jgi:urease accessory protein
VVLGAALGRRGAEPEVAALAFLYSSAALLVGAGLRLIALGQLEGQRVLAAAQPVMARLARRAATSALDDMWSFNPATEIAGVRHGDLAMRLFRS